MAAHQILLKSVTSQFVEVMIRDSTTGQGKTGIAFGSVAARYMREGAAANVSISVVSGTLGTYTSGGWVEVDATGTPGLYQFGVPNAAVLTGVEGVTLQFKISGAIDKNVRIILIDANLRDAVHLGLSGIPNAAAGATGGLPLSVDTSGRVDVLKVNGTSQTARDLGASVLLSSGTGTGQVDVTAGVVKANQVQILGTALTETVGGYLAAAYKKFLDVAVPVFTAASVNQSGDGYARLGAPANATIAADIAGVDSKVSNLENLSALANLFGPSQLVRPESGNLVYTFSFIVKDVEGHLLDVDTNAVTLTAVNAAGTDRSANLSAVTHAGTGEYKFTYTVASSHLDEGISITASGTVQSATRKAWANCAVADANVYSDLATLLTRIPSALTITGGKVDVNDKTGFALTAGEHTNIAADVQTGLTAQGVTTARAGYLDTLNGLVAAIWANGTRTLTAALDSSGITTLLSRITGAVLLAAGYTVPPTVAQIDTQLTGSHGAGAWGGGSGSAPTAAQIDAQLSGTHGAGAWGPTGASGAFSVVLTITDANTAATLHNVTVTVKNAAEGTTYDQKITDGAGLATFSLDAGTYHILVTPPTGYSSLAAQTLVVSANTTHTYGLTPVVVPSAGGGNALTLFGYEYAGDDTTPVANRSVKVALLDGPAFSGARTLETVGKTYLTDAAGAWQAPVSRGKTYLIEIPAAGLSKTITVTADTGVTQVNIKDA